MKSCLFEAIIINQGILRLDHDVQIPVSPVRLEERCQRNNNLIVAVASETSAVGFKSSYDSESVGTDTNSCSFEAGQLRDDVQETGLAMEARPGRDRPQVIIR